MAEGLGAIVLVGANGMLGSAYRAELSQRGERFVAVDVPDIDLARPDSVQQAIPRGTQLVINCAAFTDVDGAEQREAEATAINGSGVRMLAARCAEVNATLVHYSTDYVFDGAARTPYPVDHPRDPQNAYGRGKAVGEEALEQGSARYLLVRTSWLYAPYGKNFVLTMRALLSSRPQVKVVDDQVGRPTSAAYLARRTLLLLERGALGTFHVTDGGQCSWYAFTCAIAEQLASTCRVLPCTTEQYLAEFPRPAKRPAYSVLDLSKTDALIGPSRDYRENLREVLAAVV